MKKKSKKRAYILIGIVLLCLIGLSIGLQKNSEKGPENENKPNQSEQENGGKTVVTNDDMTNPNYRYTNVGYTYSSVDNDSTSFNGKTYTLPEKHKARTEYEEDGVLKLNFYNPVVPTWGAVVKLIKLSDIANLTDMNELFTNVDTLREFLKNDETIESSDSKVINHKGVNILAFECPYYYKDIVGKMLYAYMPAYNDYVYAIRLTSGKTVTEFIYDYDALDVAADILLSAK